MYMEESAVRAMDGAWVSAEGAEVVTAYTNACQCTQMYSVQEGG